MTVHPYLHPKPSIPPQSQSYDGKAADIWSCGIVLYTMLVGKYPFEVNVGVYRCCCCLHNRITEKLSKSSLQTVACACTELYPGPRLTLLRLACRPAARPCLPPFAQGNNNDQGIGLGQEMMEMLQKMKTQDYKIPESLNLTPECCKLLHAMLQPSIDQRIKMAGIMSDPWFLTHLPPNAINMNDGYLAKPRPCAQTEAEIRAIVKQAARS